MFMNVPGFAKFVNIFFHEQFSIYSAHLWFRDCLFEGKYTVVSVGI